MSRRKVGIIFYSPAGRLPDWQKSSCGVDTRKMLFLSCIFCIAMLNCRLGL